MHCESGKLKEILQRNTEFSLFEEKSLLKENASQLYFADEVKELSGIAEEAMTKRPYTPLLSEYRLFSATGNAEGYFIPYSERRMYFNALVFMAIVTEDDKYLPYIEDYIWAMIHTYKWTSPRDNFFFEEKGKDGIPHEECLDLLSTETAFTFAETDAILGDRLSPFIRKQMKEASLKRVINSFANKDYYHWWEFCEHNWGAVCGCSVAGAAMYYLDDVDELAEILQRILKTMERFLSGYKNDGVCVEGVSYWKYGFSYYVFFCELLKQRTNGEMDLMQSEKVHQIALYLQRCRVEGNVTLNFGDSFSRLSYGTGFLHKLKSYFPDVLIPPAKYAVGLHADKRYRWAGFIRDYAWFNKELVCDCEDVLVDSYFFEESQIYISHKNSTCFAVTGGHNGYSHNHNDLGNFIYHAGGKGIFIDLGQGVYCKGYFSEQRYTFLNTSSAGHSLPQINGQVQQGGEEYCVREMKVEQGKTDMVAMDLTGAYNCKELEKLERAFCYWEDGELQIRDRIELKDKAVITESFVVNVTEEPVWEPGRITLRNQDVTVLLLFDKRFRLDGIGEVPPEILSQGHSRGMRIIRMSVEPERNPETYEFTILKQ